MGTRFRSFVIALVAVAVAAVGVTASTARAAYVLEVNPATWCTVFGASGATNHFNYSTGCNFNDYWGMSWAPQPPGDPGPPAPAQHQFLAYRFTAPSWLTLTSAITTTAGVMNVNTGGDWYGASYWNGGSHGWPSGNSGAVISDGGFGSSYWGFLLECETAPSCSTLGSMQVANVVLIGNESTAPSLAALGYGNLWYETSRYVWNPAGDPWPFPVSASDPSGVCNLSSAVNGVPITGPSYTPNLYVLQQCPNPTWNTTVDTRAYMPGSGSLSLQYHATNAAGNTSSPSETVSVDNDPVSISLSSLSDANPASTWVNHAVNMTAFASAGPSGVAGTSCSQDGATPQAYPAEGLTIDGDGVHTVSCTAWNNAVDPQGAYNSATTSQTVHIDEAPPSIAFEPQNPGAPTQLVVDTADGESGVQGGSITMARVGSSAWTTLPSGFDGQHLVAQVNDTGLHGTYIVRATSCDNAGNCATTQEPLSLPLRTQAVAVVGFTRVQAPAKVVRERVRVGWHYKRIRRHGHLARIKAGGHMITVRLVIRRNAACTHRRVRTGPHRWHELTACRALRLVTDTRRRVPYGKPITIHGVLATRAGAPIAGAPLAIETAPRNGLGRFHTVAIVTTAPNGSWSLTLRAGPSRTIRALYFGSATALPTSGQATTTVPARITIAISPRTVPWGSTIRITGRVLGGYVPANSSLIRLNVGIGKIGRLVGLPTISPNGRFVIVWRFSAGQSVVHPWFSVETLPESAFPYAPGTSVRVVVTVG